MVPCPQPVAMMGGDADAALLALQAMYDLYGECGARLVELIDAVQGSEER